MFQHFLCIQEYSKLKLTWWYHITVIIFFSFLFFKLWKYNTFTGDLENTEQGYRTKLPIVPLYMTTVIILMCHLKDDSFAGRMESFILYEVKELTWASWQLESWCGPLLEKPKLHLQKLPFERKCQKQTFPKLESPSLQQYWCFCDGSLKCRQYGSY